MFSKFIGFSSDSSHTQIRLGDIVHMITHISCVLVSSKILAGHRVKDLF